MDTIKDVPDPFANRYGYVPGRCNAYRHIKGHPPRTDGLCKQFPAKGRRRCHRHGSGYGRGRNNDAAMAKARAKRWPKKEDVTICNNLLPSDTQK